MSIRFKFRSSATFDSLDLGGKSFITIRDLKFEIVKMKHLNLAQDVDLIFSDFSSGEEFKDENTRIYSSSSVIIKRVPAASPPLFRGGDVPGGCFGAAEADLLNTVEPPAEIDGAGDFDDFGVDLCPLPDANLLNHGNLPSNNSERRNCMATRCSGELPVSCHKLDATHHGQSAPKVSSGGMLLMQSKPKIEEQMLLERTFPANHLAMDRSDMPPELKCSLCRNFFKEAVMIPCCQHSFCETCIRISLAQNAKCPMCFSTKFKADDLLPNVSLRQAIEHFLQSQPLPNGSENDLHRYAPDGESGIQVDLSYAAPAIHRNLQLNRCATGKRPNQIMQNKVYKHGDIADIKCPAAVEDSTEFEGENDPQNIVRTDVEDSCTKKENRFRVIPGGEETNVAAPARLQRGQRTCYMCGSPDHLIRDCPVTSSPHTNHWNGTASCAGSAPGCAPQYWPGSPPIVRPFVNMYGGPGMLYNSTMPPGTSFGYPPYAPSMYAAYPMPSGPMQLGVGGVAPQTGNNGPQPRYAEVLQGRQEQQRDYNGDFGRERISHRVHDNMERGMNQSDDSLAKRSEGNPKRRNHSDDDTYSFGERREKISRREGGRDLRVFQSVRSPSEKEMSGSRIHPKEDGHEKHLRSSRTNDERTTHYGRESKRESPKRRRMEHDHRKSDREFHSYSRSSREHSYSSDGARQRREESSHRSRHPKKISKSNDKELYHGREKMTKYPNDDDEYYHGQKRKRFH